MILLHVLRRPDSLRRACQSATPVMPAAHAVLGGRRKRFSIMDDTGHGDLIASAMAGGVYHFVYTSDRGVRPDRSVTSVCFEAGGRARQADNLLPERKGALGSMLVASNSAMPSQTPV